MKFGLTLVATIVLFAPACAQDKIDLSGNYEVVRGKKEGRDIDEKAKKAKYSATTDTFTIEAGDVKMVISYTLKPGTSPREIDMVMSAGPDGTKGIAAYGIVEVKDDTLKLAYSLNKDKRPSDFEGKTGYVIELKKIK
ncbi:MAG: TIGR03067 domain-containing protein [Gemmataceae bacterium]|nr:TIGR03067 domain-containing protein [Gemmata sp.]MDW8197936.1 TIGR03067 domain-containing protein [Gemmataceae bacterium]